MLRHLKLRFILATFIVCGTVMSCDSYAQGNDASAPRVIAVQQANAQSLCDRVSEIKLLPLKGERVDDDAYNALIEAGESALPCLIAKVTDTRKMRDPRQGPLYGDVETRVGDVAYFVLVRIAKIHFVELLPVEVQKKYKAEGASAYFKFVQKKRNRRWLHRELEAWFRGR
jgi:hypothetical protein